jgi:hypothetical protein
VVVGRCPAVEPGDVALMVPFVMFLLFQRRRVLDGAMRLLYSEVTATRARWPVR